MSGNATALAANAGVIGILSSIFVWIGPTPLISESEEDMSLRLVDTAMPRRVTCSDRSHIHELLPRPDVVFPTNAGYG